MTRIPDSGVRRGRLWMRVLFAAVLVSSFGTASCGEKNYEDEFEKWAAQRRRKVKHVDLLRPEEEKLRLIYFGMLEEMREKEISPEVSVETREWTHAWRGFSGTKYKYTVRIPEKYQSIRREYRSGPGRRLEYSYWTFYMYALEDRRLSFYAFLADWGPANENTWRDGRRRFQFLEAEAPRRAYSDYFDEQFDSSAAPPYSSPGAPTTRYLFRCYHQHCRTLERLDPTGRRQLEWPTGGFGSGGWREGWTTEKYRQTLGNREAYKGRNVLLRTGDAVFETDAKKRAGLIKGLPRTDEQEEAFASFFCYATAEDLPLVARTLVEYFRAGPKPKPYHTDLAMALFVARGYEFDPKTGTYRLNKSGKALLDYVVQHARPNVMADLGILREHGCADLLDRLLKKHHPKVNTWDAFRRKLGLPAEDKAKPETLESRIPAEKAALNLSHLTPRQVKIAARALIETDESRVRLAAVRGLVELVKNDDLDDVAAVLDLCMAAFEREKPPRMREFILDRVFQLAYEPETDTVARRFFQMFDLDKIEDP
ncbi:MAG: hypothetical protein ACOC7K_01835, partial [bacterium]